MPIVDLKTNRTDINETGFFNEKDSTIPRKATSQTNELLLTQITGGICVGEQVIAISNDKESGFLCLNEFRNIGLNWLYAKCVLMADSASTEDIKAFYRESTPVTGWKHFEDTDTGIKTWELPSADDHVAIALPPDVEQKYGMPLGDKAVFEVRGRENVLNFRIKGTEPVTHYLYVSYYA